MAANSAGRETKHGASAAGDGERHATGLLLWRRPHVLPWSGGAGRQAEGADLGAERFSAGSRCALRGKRQTQERELIGKLAGVQRAKTVGLRNLRFHKLAQQ